jgi:hypothetical protein
MLSLLTEGCRRRKFPLRHPLVDDQQNHHSRILPLDGSRSSLVKSLGCHGHAGL